jgi:hypothetical protein
VTVFEVSPELLALAESWPVYEDTQTNAGNVYEEAVTRACVRCQECDCVLVAGDTPGRAYHLMTHHGYRMDGRRDGEA